MKNALKKTFCCLLSATVLTVSASTAFAKSADFTDVPEKGWYTEAVDYVSEAGLFSGKGNGIFDPDGVMNRAMMVQVLANATENYKKESFTVGGFAGTGMNSFDVLPYTDVDETQTWYGPPIRWATMYQIASGKGNGKFAPFAAITREETATMLFRYAQKTKNETGHQGTAIKKFSDANAVSSWAVNAVDWAVEKGILNGYPDGSLRPGKRITRAEAAMVFLNTKNVLKNRTVTFPMTETAQNLGITAETYPKVDGSKLTQDLANNLYRTMHGINDPHGFHHSKTRSAYEKLIAGDTDLILVLDPDDEVLKKAESAGVQLEGYEIARDGLAFETPEKNTAKNVSVEQLQQIYSDYSIQNWSVLGGENRALIPYCGTSGMDDDRQTQLERQILKGLPLNEQIQKQYAFESWNEVISHVQGSGEPNSDGIGIAPMNFAIYQELPYLSKGLKLLSVNGMEPTEKNIADGSYPLTYSYYAVIRADEPENSSARKLAQWLQTEEAGELVEQSGFIQPF